MVLVVGGARRGEIDEGVLEEEEARKGDVG